MLFDLLSYAIVYCAAILVPVPWLSRLIIDGWAWLWAKVTGAATVKQSVVVPRTTV